MKTRTMIRRAFFSAATVAAIVNIACSPVSAKPREGCVLAAEIGIEAVCQGAMAGCLTSQSPLACAVAGYCQSAAAKSLAKIGTAEGCSFVIDVVNDKLVILIRGDREKADTMRKAHRALTPAKGLRWLETKIE